MSELEYYIQECTNGQRKCNNEQCVTTEAIESGLSEERQLCVYSDLSLVPNTNSSSSEVMSRHVDPPANIFLVPEPEGQLCIEVYSSLAHNAIDSSPSEVTLNHAGVSVHAITTDRLVSSDLTVSGETIDAVASVQSLAESLFQFQKSGHYCDTVIVADDGELKAHSAVLAALSPVFHVALSDKGKLQQHTLMLPGVQLVVAEIVVQFMYTGRITVPNDNSDCLGKVMDAINDLGIKVHTCSAKDQQHAAVQEEPRTRYDCDSEKSDGNLRLHVQVNGYQDMSSVVNVEAEEDDAVATCDGILANNHQCPGGSDPEMDTDVVDDEKYEHITSDAGMVCEFCGRHCKNSKSLRKHLELHRNRPRFPCSYCHMTFSNGFNLRRHETLHTGKKRFLCHYCAESFRNRVSLLNHEFRNHNEKVESDPSKRPFGCRVCMERFHCSSDLRKHMYAQHKATVCDVCGNRFSNEYVLKRHVCNGKRRKQNSMFRCSICSGYYSTAARLHRHMVMLHSARDSTGSGETGTCSVCSETFKSRSAFTLHMRTHEKDCSVCAKRFRTRQQLEIHERIHSGEKPFRCNICEKEFRQQTHLIRHSVTHTDMKPFGCTLCSKSYRQKGDLRNHCSRVHNVQL